MAKHSKRVTKKNVAHAKKSRRRRVREHRQVNRFIAGWRKSIETDGDNQIDDSLPQVNSETPLNQLLRSWVNCHGITTRAVNDLLKILRNSGAIVFFI